MRVYDIMSSGVKTVPITAAAGEAWEMMRGHTIGSVVVVDKGSVTAPSGSGES